MRECLREANLAFEAGEVPVGAILVKDGEILARAHNQRETSTDPTAHAEILALREGAARIGSWNLSGCTLYVTLEPCPMCAGAIVQSHLSRVVFGAFHKEGGACGSRVDLTTLAPSCRFEGGLLHEEAAELMTRFFRDKREEGTFY